MLAGIKRRVKTRKSCEFVFSQRRFVVDKEHGAYEKTFMEWERFVNFKKYRSRICTVFLCIGLILMAAVFVGVAAYTRLIGDDYGVLVSYSQGNGFFNAVKTSWDMAVRLFFRFGGYVVSYFAVCLMVFSISEGWLSLTGVMVVGTLLMLGVLALFVVSALRTSGACHGMKERNIALFMVAASWYLFLDIDKWPEINNWVTGYSGYVLPITLALWVASLMCWNQSAGKARIAFTAVLAFLASGGSLQITGVYCYLLLILLLVKLFQKTAKPADWIVFFSAFAGALLNVAAPGNYTRRLSLDPSGFHPANALPYVVKYGNEAVADILKSSFGCAILLGILALGVYSFKRFEQRRVHLVLLILACMVVPYLSALPVCVGYGGEYFPNRCQWVTAVATDLAVLCIAYTLGILLGKSFEGYNKTLQKVAVLAAFLLLGIGAFTFSKQSPLYSTAVHLVDGTIAECTQDIVELETLLQNSAGEDVVIREPLQTVDELLWISLRNDPNYWNNQVVAKYYHLNSLVYEPQ